MGILFAVRVFFGWTTLVMFALAPGVATADMLPDPGYVCRSKSRGDACTIAGDPGRCMPGLCEHFAYTEGDRPDVTKVECMICKPVAPEPDAKGEGASKSDGCTVGSPAPVGLGVVLFGCAFWTRRRS